MPDDNAYDLIVLGGGPAGIVGASIAATLRKRVALVDKSPELGGAGINTGTLPSKTLRETALALSGFRSRALYGVDLSLRREATVADFMYHEQRVRHTFNIALAENMTRRKIDTLSGTAQFADPHTIVVRGADGVERHLRGERVLIATGSAPVRPPEYPFDDLRVHDSDQILKLQHLPKSMAVIGAGTIGAEYACTFNALGVEIHLIDGRESLMPFLDGEVSRALANAMAANGIRFHWKTRVTRCAVHEPDGVTLELSTGGVLEVADVLVAAGRRSSTDELNLTAAGITPGERGLITVNGDFQTEVPHIYAAGDVIGFPALASTSMEQARHAVMHALGAPSGSGTPLLPSGVYTIPEASMVGETEESLTKKGIDYVVGRAFYRENPRGGIIGDGSGFLKLLFRRPDMKLLGAHVMGDQATEVIHIGLLVMLTNSGAELLEQVCFNFPTLGMMYKRAVLAATLESEPAPAKTSPA